MLDSLVRVSRRDEWITDLLTLDNDFYVLDKNLSVTQLLAFFLIKNIEKWDFSLNNYYPKIRIIIKKLPINFKYFKKNYFNMCYIYPAYIYIYIYTYIYI